MIIDTLLEFSDAQAVTSTAISTVVYDAGPTTDNAFRDLGAGDDLYLVVQTQTAITDTSSDATLVVTLESADNAGLSTNATVHFSTGTLAFATYSPAGTVIAAVRVPSANYRRYLGVRYTVASGPFTAGAIDAFLTHDIQRYRAYADRQPIEANA